ncbi:hypothetical protein [Flavobacterium aquidurense]|uniref:hypothetical protein n=1 Tax=Flavobacterium aquidurense TaxID=362413 RepID=UPI00371C956D
MIAKKENSVKKIYRIDIKEKYKNIHKYESDTIEYLDAILEYENSKKNHEISMSLKQYPTFHHLFVVYKNGSKKVQKRLIETKYVPIWIRD